MLVPEKLLKNKYSAKEELSNGQTPAKYWFWFIFSQSHPSENAR